MDGSGQDVAAIVTKLKDGARASPWVPLGVAPRERYHHFPDGLSLCFTLDILPKWFSNRLAGELGEEAKFWHLSIARLEAGGPRPEEVEFWRRAFFEEEPLVKVPGLITGITSRHFFWRVE